VQPFGVFYWLVEKGVWSRLGDKNMAMAVLIKRHALIRELNWPGSFELAVKSLRMMLSRAKPFKPDQIVNVSRPKIAQQGSIELRDKESWLCEDFATFCRVCGFEPDSYQISVTLEKIVQSEALHLLDRVSELVSFGPDLSVPLNNPANQIEMFA
jgi:hypothetical protein